MKFRKKLTRKGYKIEKWGKVEAVINDQPTFLRPGSSKPAGWQVTFRGSKPNSFKTKLQGANGYLLMPRGPILLIPLEKIKEHVITIDTEAFKRDTIDIFIRFDDEMIFLVYKRNEVKITEFAIEKYP